MNKNGEKEGKRSKGQQKDHKLPKVNKTRGNDNKLPGEENGGKADDISNKFPNFSLLTKEERSVFFEALTAARKNVERRGAPTRKRFGTVHDEYLEYFNRDEKKEGDSLKEEEEEDVRSFASHSAHRERSSLNLHAGDPPEEAVEEEPRTPTPPPESPRKTPREASEPSILNRCESVIEEDTNKILDLYQKKKKKNAKANASNKKTEQGGETKTPRTQGKETQEKPKKKKNESASELKASDSSLKLSDTPRFDALSAEEKEIFFKILQEARENVVVKNPGKKNEILPMDSIMKRYRDDVEPKSVFTATQDTLQFGQCQRKKKLKVKVTFTSGDNERFLETIPENVPECLPKNVPESVPESIAEVTPKTSSDSPPKSLPEDHSERPPEKPTENLPEAEKAAKKGKKPAECADAEDLDLSESRKTENAKMESVERVECPDLRKGEENPSKQSLNRNRSTDVSEIKNTTATKKSSGEDEKPPSPENKACETLRKARGKSGKPKNVHSNSNETEKAQEEPEKEGKPALRGSSSSSFKGGKKKSESEGGGTLEGKPSSSTGKKEKGKKRVEMKMTESRDGSSRELTEEKSADTMQQKNKKEEKQEGRKKECEEAEEEAAQEEISEHASECSVEKEAQEGNDKKSLETPVNSDIDGTPKAESEGGEFEETRSRTSEKAEKPLKEETGVPTDGREQEETKEKETEQGRCSTFEQWESPWTKALASAEPKDSEVPRDEQEERSSPQERPARGEKPSQAAENANCACDLRENATPKVMIVDDNVIEKIRNLIYYLEAKASRDDVLAKEYMQLLLDYVDYLSKVLETLVLKKEEQQEKNAFVAAQMHLKFDEEKNKVAETNKFTPRSVSGEDLGKMQFVEEKKKKPDKSKDDDWKGGDDSGLLFLSDSDSSMESQTQVNFMPPAPTSKKVVTTKIRLLQDLIKKRAEFVQGSTEEFTIVHRPQEEFVPKPRLKAVKLIKEEDEDSPTQDRRMKIFKALVKFCRCGKDKQKEDGVYENLKGEAVRVDVIEDERDPANATLNHSTIEVLKASGRKKIIDKYYNKE